jgi:hypothetical protein
MARDPLQETEHVHYAQRVATLRRALAPSVVVIGDDAGSTTIVDALERASLVVACLKGAAGLRTLIVDGPPSVIISTNPEDTPLIAGVVRRFASILPDGRSKPALVVVAEERGQGDGDFRWETVPSSAVLETLGDALAQAVEVLTPAYDLTRALGVEDSPSRASDSMAKLELTFGQYRDEIGRALAWAAPEIGFEGRALVARFTLDGHTPVTSSIRVLSDAQKTLPGLKLLGALPHSAGGASRIAPERGLHGLIASIGEIELDEPAVDRRFIISGERERAEEWRALAGPLTVLATNGDVRGEVGDDRVVIDVDGASVWTIGECARALHQAWVTLVNGRLGLSSDHDEAP